MSPTEKARAGMSAGSRRRWDNPDSDERVRYADYMRRSLHVRWHEKRDVTNPDCEFCTS